MTLLTVDGLLRLLEKRPIIAAVRTPEDNRRAIESQVAVISMISTSIFQLDEMVAEAHAGGKVVLLHIDLAEGLGRDDAAVRWCVQRLGVDGLISTKPNLLRAAADLGVVTVQRFFMVDSASMAHGKRLLKNTPPHLVEVLPAIAPKGVRMLCQSLDKPIIAAGMVTEPRDVALAMQAGARAVSTGHTALWDYTL